MVLSEKVKFLRCYSIDLVDFITLFLRQLDKKLKFKDLKILSPVPLSAKIIVNFCYCHCKYQDRGTKNSISNFLFKGKYYTIAINEKEINILDYDDKHIEGVGKFYFFYEEMIFPSVYSLFDGDSLIKLMMKEVINEETRRLIRTHLNKNEKINEKFKRVLFSLKKFHLNLDCRGRLYSQNTPETLQSLKIIRIGNFRRVYPL